MTRKAVFVQRLASDSCGDERNGLHNHTVKLTKQSFSNMCVPKLEFGNKLNAGCWMLDAGDSSICVASSATIFKSHESHGVVEW